MGKKKVAEQNTPPVAEEVRRITVKPAASGKVKRLEHARVYINSSYNNTVVSVTDVQGNLITWATAGSLGFSGPKKATPFAAGKIIAVISEKLRGLDAGEVEVYVRGVGGGRDSAIRSLMNQGFNIISIKDVTPVPHNGPRPPKVRRV